MTSWLTNWLNWVTTFRTDRWQSSRRERLDNATYSCVAIIYAQLKIRISDYPDQPVQHSAEVTYSTIRLGMYELYKPGWSSVYNIISVVVLTTPV